LIGKASTSKFSTDKERTQASRFWILDFGFWISKKFEIRNLKFEIAAEGGALLPFAVNCEKINPLLNTPIFERKYT
jgi:hypothetical protein